jgi:hypothetical protein
MSTMKTLSIRWAAALVLAFAAAGARAQAELDTTPGLLAARVWLAQMDGGSYGASYDGAAPALRDGVSRVQWEKDLVRVREPLGGVVNRKIRQAACTRGTPADPEAEACLIQYNTYFENRPLGDEQLTLLRGRDGVWRVAAYQLR